MNYAADPLKDVVVKGTWSKATNTYKGYTIAGVTLTTPTILSASYYDSYEFMGYNSIPANTDANTKYTAESGYGTWYGADYNEANKYKNKGLLTGSLTAQYQSDGTVASTYLYSVIYYDDRGRIVQTKSNNHLTGGLEKEYIAYNFTGQPTQKKHVHSATDKDTQTEVYTYAYDHAGRLLTTKHKLNTEAEVILAENSYDELGRLKTNKKGGQANLNTTYAYNVRSWTTSIAGPLFKESLFYNAVSSPRNPCYNGNISAIIWDIQGDNRGYDFEYDNLSRLKVAYYKTGETRDERFNAAYTYDKHGNIVILQRRGKKDAGRCYLLWAGR